MAEPEINTPNQMEKRSIARTLGSLLSASFWFLWDSFWKIFNLDSVGDAMKEHSPSLNNKRAGVLIALIIVSYLGGCIESNFDKAQIDTLNGNLKTANDTIIQLRNYNAGRPHTESPAELMGLHDQTNIVAVTNIISVTNAITSISTLTNIINFFVSAPVLDFLQMERIKAKLDSVPHVPIDVFYATNDASAFNLSKQIAQIFLGSGFQTQLRGPTTWKMPFNGVTIASKIRPTGPIGAAFLQLWYELGQSQQWDSESNLPDQNIWILVTTTQK
jgi:hypothetical protein